MVDRTGNDPFCLLGVSSLDREAFARLILSEGKYGAGVALKTVFQQGEGAVLEDLLLGALLIEYLMKAPLPEAIIIGKSDPVGFTANALFLARFFCDQWANPHPNLDHLLVHVFDYNERKFCLRLLGGWGCEGRVY